MSPETIRIIDIWAGRIICFLLTLVRRLTDIFRQRDDYDEPPKKILFIKLIEQGATVLAYSAIQRAIQMAGRKNIYFCVFAENREILDILDLLPPENIFAVRHKNLLQFILDISGLLIKVRRLDIDATVDMEFFARASAILAFLTGAGRRVGLHRFTGEGPYRGDLMTHRVHYNPYVHTAKAYHLLVEALMANPDDVPLLKVSVNRMSERAPVFVPQAEELKRVKEIIDHEFGRSPEGPIVLLNPNASDMLPLRKWDTDNFVTLGKRILASHSDVFIAVTGAPSEALSAQDVCRRLGSERAFCLAGKTTLRELLVLYTIAHMLVTNDSGPGHFASMTNIVSIVMYGPETPRLFGPIGGRGRVIYTKLACSPCVNVFNHRFSPCRNNVCMQEISVDSVYETVQDCLRDLKP
ncbi:MAG: glycosyltransferase family 9 protein [Syntrophales bacterium]|nr:glycosyltransferase family 9 protein [Syntrophales bacterium]